MTAPCDPMQMYGAMRAHFGHRRWWPAPGGRRGRATPFEVMVGAVLTQNTNWKNVERAEYRLAHTHLQLGDANSALQHARGCLEICEANGEDAGEMFFAHEALAKAWHAKGDADGAGKHRADAAGRLAAIDDDGFRSFCEAELEKLDALLG